MELILSMKMSYGVTRFYPENETAKNLLEWQEKKTFSLSDLDSLKMIGFKISIIEQGNTGINEY